MYLGKIFWPCLLAVTTTIDVLTADEPVTLENAESLAIKLGIDLDGRAGTNLPEEPLKEKFSAEAATRFLDISILHWQQKQECFACHTNYPYLMARPLLGAADRAHQQVRTFAAQTVTKQWSEQGANFDAEVVSIVALLAFNDAMDTGKLHKVTRQALDHTASRCSPRGRHSISRVGSCYAVMALVACDEF